MTYQRILITGANGQVGWSLQHNDMSKKLTLIAPEENTLDITSADQIDHAINEYKPDIIVNAAAYTAVDKAEEEKEKCFQANEIGSKRLAESCLKHQIPLFHISTDYVFDGEQERAYIETDKPSPINQYGKSKLAGEKAIQETLQQHIILRVSGVFCSHGNNFVKTMLRLAKERDELDVVFDQITCPTAAANIATVIFKMIEQLHQNTWGIYHYCDKPALSWHEFATMIIDLAREKMALRVKNINAISSDAYHCLAKRPPHAVLICDKIRTVFGIEQMPWEIELNRMMAVYLK